MAENSMGQISQFLSWHGGLFLFVAALIEQSGLPIPAAPFFLAAGALAVAGQLNLITAIAWTAVGCLAADTFWFYAGHRGKDRLLPFFGRFRRSRRAHPSTTGVKATFRSMRALTVAKFIPLGTLLPLRAGTLDVSPLRFLVLDVPGSLIYSSVYLLLGFFFHRQLHQLTAIIRGLGVIGLLLVFLLAGIYAAGVFVRRRHFNVNFTNNPGVKISNSHSRTRIQATTKS